MNPSKIAMRKSLEAQIPPFQLQTSTEFAITETWSAEGSVTDGAFLLDLIIPKQLNHLQTAMQK